MCNLTSTSTTLSAVDDLAVPSLCMSKSAALAEKTQNRPFFITNKRECPNCRLVAIQAKNIRNKIEMIFN